MNNEGLTSLAVVDNQSNVIGNISNVDVKVCSANTHPANNKKYRFNALYSYLPNQAQPPC